MTKKYAFTLIELLVVIAIIAILAAILFPVFAQAKVAAKKAKAITQSKQLGTGTMIYMSDYDDMFPPKVRIGQGPATGGGDPFNSMTWDDIINPYVKNWNLFMSSEDPRPLYSVPGRGQYRRSFAPASHVFQGVQVSWGVGSISSTSIPAPSGTVMFVEARQPVFNVPNIRNADQWWWDVAANNSRTMNLPSSDPRAPFGTIDNKYADASVFIWVDSSARVLKRNGTNSTGLPSGTVIPGYRQVAAAWVGGSGDPFWDRGLVCFDAPWSTSDTNQPCPFPEQ
ncbi:MAG: prepilin-type N-terminal cleavage/methylation domain-containing protein [Fimbriimonadaceae bacterium]|jgi:prepilin-type N-terminal cleavage/methylation domain-containing protein|nr:prepilin-type N-terminal cleavage/methylation domain-containing protein [Fimbriimonadaceae bacterium]